MRIFRAGEILPDTPGVQSLVAQNLAEVVADVKTAKAPKKRDTEKVSPTPKNDESNT
ncbi:MAG: hypothetical protein IJS42_01425 [Synergistaceae bacterium]|nr:hypothetical protein [Synergistaceae bacterium]